MKLSVLATFLLVFSACSTKFNTVTYNIRYDTPNDGSDRWSNRKSGLVNQIKEIDPDIIGFQEALDHQVNYLDSMLSGHHYYGVGRDDGIKAGEYSPIFFKNSKYQLIEEGTFWLSPTPDRISIGWDAALERICSYIKLQQRDGEMIWIFNTHFDHVGVLARKESAQLIINKIEELVQGQRVILMGDFNLITSEVAIHNIGNYFYQAGPINPSGGKRSTFNGFDLNYNNHRIIDHIFGNESGLKLIKYKIIDNRGGHSFWSDHLPVQAIFRAKK